MLIELPGQAAHDIFGEAAVHRIAVFCGNSHKVSQPPSNAGNARTRCEPGDADLVAFLHMGHAGIDRDDTAHALMPGDEKRIG